LIFNGAAAFRLLKCRKNSAAALATGLSATLIGCRDELSRRHFSPGPFLPLLFLGRMIRQTLPDLLQQFANPHRMPIGGNSSYESFR
jgi:hypothetical protein